MSNEIQRKTDWAQAAMKFDTLACAAQEAFAIKGNFARTFALGSAMADLREALDAKVMQSIMKLKGSQIGFRTDEHGATQYEPEVVYGEEVVRDCVIQACVYGLQLVGNQFNILAGRFYPTKEGFTYLLRNLEGLRDFKLLIRPADVRESRTSGTDKYGKDYQKIEREALVKVDVSFTWNGKAESHGLEFCIRVNRGMSIDAVNGKAERKAKAWVYNYLTDNALADADAEDGAGDVPPMRDVTPPDRGKAPVMRAARPEVQEAEEVEVEPDGAVDADTVEAPAQGSVDVQGGPPAPEVGGKFPHLTAVKRVFDANGLRGWGEVYRILDKAGLEHPQMGAPTGEMEEFAGRILAGGELMNALELNGIHFDGGKEAK